MAPAIESKCHKKLTENMNKSPNQKYNKTLHEALTNS